MKIECVDQKIIANRFRVIINVKIKIAISDNPN